jgi:hypothetical protein
MVSGSLDTTIVLTNRDPARTARVLVRFSGTDKTTRSRFLLLSPGASQSVPMIETVAGQETQFFSAVEGTSLSLSNQCAADSPASLLRLRG